MPGRRPPAQNVPCLVMTNISLIPFTLLRTRTLIKESVIYRDLLVSNHLTITLTSWYEYQHETHVNLQTYKHSHVRIITSSSFGSNSRNNGNNNCSSTTKVVIIVIIVIVGICCCILQLTYYSLRILI